MNLNILFVDDDPNILEGVQRNLRRDFSIQIALGPEEGLRAILARGPYAVVVADMQMPKMNGIDFLIKVKEKSRDTVRIMLTGNADQKTASEAVNHGHIFRFLTKPCPLDELTLALNAGLEQFQLITAERELLERTLSGSVKMLTDILSMLDPASFGDGQRLRNYVCVFAKSAQLPETWKLLLAAMLSQIGVVTVPSTVLERSRSGSILTDSEKDILARVPQIGADLLANIPRLASVSEIVRYQNKNFDGTGYPIDPIGGESIPIGARIIRILRDLLDFEAQSMSKLEAFHEMKLFIGRYDPNLLQAATVAFEVVLPSEYRSKAEPKPETKAQTGEEAKLGTESVPKVEFREITFKELQVGYVLGAGLMTLDGTLIARAGTEISPMLFEKLQNFNQLSRIKEPILIAKR